MLEMKELAQRYRVTCPKSQQYVAAVGFEPNPDGPPRPDRSGTGPYGKHARHTTSGRSLRHPHTGCPREGRGPARAAAEGIRGSAGSCVTAPRLALPRRRETAPGMIVGLTWGPQAQYVGLSAG